MEPYEVLGVSPQAPRTEVASAYKVLAQIFHPDRYAGSPAAVRDAAARRMAMLNDAYKAIRDGRAGGAEAATETNGSGPRRRPTWAGTTTTSWAGATRQARPKDPTAQREAAARAAREHDAQARVSKARRTEARQAAGAGQARSAPKAKARAVAGLGQALHTNELTCRGCKSVQKLPAGWQDQLDERSWYCSFCDRLILSR